MARREYGGIGRALSITSVVLVLLALTGLVAYLVSDINHRRYRLAVRNGQLNVERGLFLPVGFAPYDPETPLLRDAYAAIVVPPNETFGATGSFEERSDLDRALFGVLSGWARTRLEAQDTPTLELASTYVKRLEILPGLSEEQRIELRALRASVAFRNGGRMMHDSVERLRRAQEEFRQAIALGCKKVSEAEHWIGEIERRIALYRDLPPAEPVNRPGAQ